MHKLVLILVKIVVLGSSTSAGAGASPSSNSYVNKLKQYLIDSVNSGCDVINLAVGGYTTRKIQPTWYGGSVDTAKNVDKALSYTPDAIIINMPSNDASSGFTLSEQKENFLRILDKTDSANVPVWITTTQPRNLSAAGRDSLTHMKDWIISTFPDHHINFWTDIAETDGSINSAYDSGDGVHLNNAGHNILFTRVINSNLIDSLCTDVPIAINTLIKEAVQIFTQNKNISVKTKNYQNISYEVYNINGQKVLSGLLQNETTNIAVYSAQLYIVRLSNPYGNYVAKVFVP